MAVEFWRAKGKKYDGERGASPMKYRMMITVNEEKVWVFSPLWKIAKLRKLFFFCLSKNGKGASHILLNFRLNGTKGDTFNFD